MTAHSIKINRAWKIAGENGIPQGRMTKAEIMAPILARPQLIERLTSRGLADLFAAMHEHWRKAQAQATAEILAEGAIWDNRAERLREIAA